MFGRLWAVARVALAQGVRMKVAIVIILFLIAVVPALPFLLQTDGTQLGRARIVVTYSLYLIMFLLSVLTLFLSTATISKEIEQKQIFVLDPKPVARWEMFAGKWIGVMLLNAILLATLGLISYGLLWYISRPSLGADKEYRDLKNRFLVSRAVVKPQLPYDIADKVNEEYEYMKQNNLLPGDRAEDWIKGKLLPVVARKLNSVAPLHYGKWVFAGLPAGLGPGRTLQFRFKHFVTRRIEGNRIEAQWIFGEPESSPYAVRRSFMCDGFQEFEVPAQIVKPDGTLTVYYENLVPGQPTVIFPYEDGLQMFYPVGSLEMNLAKALLAILLMIGFFAALGLVCGACLSFPVAILLVLAVFMMGIGADFLGGSIKNVYLFGPDVRAPGAAMHWADRAMHNILGAGIWVFPPVLQFSPVPFVKDALEVPWNMIAREFMWIVIVRGGLVALLGAYLFHRRELGSAVN